jgi:hypothetical protein
LILLVRETPNYRIPAAAEHGTESCTELRGTFSICLFD